MDKETLKLGQLVGAATLLNTMRKRNFLTDVVLVSDDDDDNEVLYIAHRAILAANSEHFGDLFEKNPEEKSVKVAGVRARYLEILLEFMYTGNLSTPSEVNVCTLLASAVELKLHLVFTHCTKLMLKSIRNDNLIEFLKTAEDFDIEELKNAILHYILNNFKSLLDYKVFNHLPLTYVENAVLKNPHDCTPDDIFEAILKWIQFNDASKLESATRLINYIDINSISTECITKLSGNPVVLRDGWIMQLLFGELSKRWKIKRSSPTQPVSEKSSLDLYYSAFESLSQRTEMPHISQMLSVPRPNLATYHQKMLSKKKDVVAMNSLYECVDNSTDNQNEGFLAGFMKAAEGWDLISYDITKDSQICSTSDSIKLPSGEDSEFSLDSGICVFGSQVYFIGGAVKWKPIQKTLFYDFYKKSWEYKADMPTARYTPGCAILEKNIFVVGGRGENSKHLNTVESYDISSNLWVCLPSMSRSLPKPAVCAYDKCLYVIGGTQESFTTDSCGITSYEVGEKYDPFKRQWTTLTTKLPIGKDLVENYFRVATVAKRIFAVSSQVHSNCCVNLFFEYNPVSGRWMQHQKITTLSNIIFIGRYDNCICFIDEDGKAAFYAAVSMKLVKLFQMKCETKLLTAVCARLQE